MTTVLNPTRRSFVLGGALGGGGLALGLQLPFGPTAADAAEGPAQVIRDANGFPEVTAWVVIRPDDTVVIRIARSEMGQGTLTGLAQLVAEELECDWGKVTTEYPTPGQNVKRARIWRDFATGGSRGIRASHEYVREGGAAARTMLVQAAANRWNVAASECVAAASVITHTPSGRSVTYGQVAEDAARLGLFCQLDGFRQRIVRRHQLLLAKVLVLLLAFGVTRRGADPWQARVPAIPAASRHQSATRLARLHSTALVGPARREWIVPGSLGSLVGRSAYGVVDPRAPKWWTM